MMIRSRKRWWFLRDSKKRDLATLVTVLLRLLPHSLLEHQGQEQIIILGVDIFIKF